MNGWRTDLRRLVTRALAPRSLALWWLASSLVAVAAPAAGQNACDPSSDLQVQFDRLAAERANDEQRWNIRPALDRWLEPASYASPVRPDRYRVGAADIDAMLWLFARQPPDPTSEWLVRVLLMPQIESFVSIAMRACAATTNSAALRVQVVALVRRWLQFAVDVYRQPGQAELVKRLQASRRKTFTLLRQVHAGNSAEEAALANLVAQARSDPMVARAASLYQEVARLHSVAVAAGQAPVAAAFAPGVHTSEQAELAIQQAQAAASLRMIDGIVAAAPLVAAVLSASRREAQREGEMSAACGFDSSSLSVSQRAEVDQCRQRWEQANPRER